MLRYKNGKWEFCNEKVRYIQRGEEIEQFVGSEGHDWWLGFADKWEHTQILEFIPIEHAEEEQQRLDEINELGLPDGYASMLSDYVSDGIFPEGEGHPLKALQAIKETEEVAENVAE